MSNDSRRPVRGFVILVALAAAAVITAVVAGQMMTAQKAGGIGIRASEEVRARAIAQSCLDMLTAYAEGTVPDAGPGSDFDSVLDPDNALSSGDEYLPFSSRIVPIPPTATDQLHQWNLVDVPGSGGVCAVRFDDNSDDGRPGLPGGGAATGATEGISPEQPQRDRDLAIYATAIGLYPLLAGTVDGDAYAKAHTRVTLRRLVQLSNVFQPLAPAMWAGTVDMKNNGDICGAGGILAVDLDMDNNSCVCGDVTTQNAATGSNPPVTGDTCSCPSSTCPSANVAVGAVPKPPLNVHWRSGLLTANAAFGPPMRADPIDEPAPIGDGIGSGHGSGVGNPGSAYDIADEAYCAFYGETNGQFFIWDRTDTNTQTTLVALALPTVLAGVPVENCTSRTTDPLPTPCAWTDGGGGNWSLACGAGESPCWKLIAVLDGVTPDQDVEVGAGSRRENTRDDGSSEEWDPQQGGGTFATVGLPNVNGIRTFGVASASPNFICGSAASCTACTNATASSGDFVEADGAGDWDFDSDATNEEGPAPSVFLLQGDVDLDNAGGGGGMGGPLRATIAASGDINIHSSSSVCCATCDCSAMGTNLDPGGNCAPANTAGVTMSTRIDNVFNDNPGNRQYTPPPTPVAPNVDNRTLTLQGGTALSAGGTVSVNTSNVIIGDVRGNLVDMTDCCIVGSVVGYSATGDCGGGGTCDKPSVCFKNNGSVVGDVHSMLDIDANNNGGFFGNIVAKGSFCANNNVDLEGTIQAYDTIELKNNAYLVNSSTSSLSSLLTTANAAAQSYMEAGW